MFHVLYFTKKENIIINFFKNITKLYIYGSKTFSRSYNSTNSVVTEPRVENFNGLPIAIFESDHSKSAFQKLNDYFITLKKLDYRQYKHFVNVL